MVQQALSKVAAPRPMRPMFVKALGARVADVEAVSATNKQGRYASKEARNAYQREYMAKRRAAAKAK
jgi:hypothetical protein